jgi:hypothetical protein
MIWHIFRKDARLLWPIAALVAALHVCAAIPHHLIDQGSRSMQLVIMGELLSALATLSVAVVVVLTMQQDPVPGARQDWLVRPIRRVDLVLAKLLFVLLMVQLPLWVVDVSIALVNGFALPGASVAAAERNLQVFCEFALPAMLLGVITRSFVEACIVAVIGLVAYVGVFEVLLALLLGIKPALINSSVAWICDVAFDLIVLGGAALVLTLQYLRRRTTLARWLVGLGVALIIGVAYVPWHLAFSVQTALSAQPAAARAIAMAFDSQAGKYRLPRGAAPVLTSVLHLPMTFTGLPVDSSVLLDRAEVRITGPDGSLLYHGKSDIDEAGRISVFDLGFEIAAGHTDGTVHFYQRISLPADIYARLANRPVRMAIDYSLTLFGASGTYALPATAARDSFPGLGRCTTGIDTLGADVTFGCMSTARLPSCYTAFLEQPATGLRNPEFHVCLPNYTPAFMGSFWPDALSRAGGTARFLDLSGMARYPVDGSKLADAKLIITTFQPRAHFTRQVDTALVRLADLTGLAAPPVASR